MNIYLIGMMGSGKSTVGKILAIKMRIPFVDLDFEIEKKVGKTVSQIFINDGEKTFRELESDLLKLYSESVVACGGGIILKKENCSFIHENGKVVFLTTSISELSKRLDESKKRPLIANKNAVKTLTKILAEREQTYLNTADFIVKTDNKTPNQITTEILKNIKI
jgi:shikimate kinase